MAQGGHNPDVGGDDWTVVLEHWGVWAEAPRMVRPAATEKRLGLLKEMQASLDGQGPFGMQVAVPFDGLPCSPVNAPTDAGQLPHRGWSEGSPRSRGKPI